MSGRRLWVVVLMLVVGGMTVVARAVQITVVDGGSGGTAPCVSTSRSSRSPARVAPSERPTAMSSPPRWSAWPSRPTPTCWMIPNSSLRPRRRFIGIDGDELAERLMGGPRTVWLAKQVSVETGEAIRELAPTAVVLVPDFARVYPLGEVAAPVVGFVGREELRMVGRAGLEHHCDEMLAGEPQTYLAVNDAIQRKVRLERLDRGLDGCDLELSLHARLQAVCETELQRAVKELRADAASAVVLDPRTGAILALGSVPSFDPAAPGRVPPEQWRLRPVQDAIEPGSTVKPVVAAAALAADSVRPGERFDCLGRGVRLAGFWIRDHVDPGRYTLDEVVAYSANTGIIEVAERIPQEVLYRTFVAFGFGRRSGIDFPAEARGLMPEVADLVQAQPGRFRPRSGAHGDAAPDGAGLRRHRQRRLAAGATSGHQRHVPGGVVSGRQPVPRAGSSTSRLRRG